MDSALWFCLWNLPPDMLNERDSFSCGTVPNETKNCLSVLRSTAISAKSCFSSSSSTRGNNTSCVPQAGRSVCHGLWRPLSSHPQRCWPSRTYGNAIWPEDSAVFSTGCRWECQPLLSPSFPVSLLPYKWHLKRSLGKNITQWEVGDMVTSTSGQYHYALWIPSMERT